MQKSFIVLFALFCLESAANAQTWGASFSKKYGQIEVGGPYAGLEFHDSRPLPSRISFYYPVANSIDLSSDYWARSESRPFAVTMRIDSEIEREIGQTGWSYTLFPHNVTFMEQDVPLQYTMNYQFALNQSCFVFSLVVKNIDSKPHAISVSTLLEFTLRTCQTYAWRNATEILSDSSHSMVIARFDSADTDSAVVFVLNVGETAVGETVMERKAGGFDYERLLGAGDSLVVVQVVGSCRRDEVGTRTKQLSLSWMEEVYAYDQAVQAAALGANHFSTGDKEIDATAVWARATLAANAHYLDGDIVPMPCPAEYNFFFTHDLLLTDLGAVHFDLQRVKRDLLYLVRRARGGVIPHAYYWRDGEFVTELCAPDNWNHLWFIIVSAGYLRHSFDTATGEILYPYLTRSLNEGLSRLGEDHLMYAAHPDWWDIGNNMGPRAYLTILTIKALREYLFVSALLGEHTEGLGRLSDLSDKLQNALVGRLWDAEKKFLMNKNGSDPDQHYYAGSILAAAYGMLDHQRSAELLKTAKRELVVPELGVRTVMPPDFHTDSSIAYFRFAGVEAGAPFAYINGGIWPQCNAWYAMGLHETGRLGEAVDFFRTTMSLRGIMRGPMGQVAMYEYRFSDPSSPEFGKIDKPSFLWAGGLTLDVLYRLLVVRENEWNCSISDRRVWVNDTLAVSYSFGSKRHLRIVGTGNTLNALRIDGALIPSLVLPWTAAGDGAIEAVFGKLQNPYLEGINAVLHDIRLSENELHLQVSSFDKYRVRARFMSQTPVKRASVGGKPVESISFSVTEEGFVRNAVTFDGSAAIETLIVQFE